MLAGILLGLSLSVLAAPDQVAVLSLDAKGSVDDLRTLQDNYNVAAQASVGIPIHLGDSLGSMTTLLGCPSADAACMGKVADSLKVRFVLYGEVQKQPGGLLLHAGLYDSKGGAEIASSEGALSSPADREGVQRVIDVLLSADAAEPLRHKAEVKVVEKRSPLRFLIPIGFGVAGGAMLTTTIPVAEALKESDDAETSAKLRGIGTGLQIGGAVALGGAAISLVLVAIPRHHHKTEETTERGTP